MPKKKITEETLSEVTVDTVESPVVEETPKETKKRSAKKEVEEPVVEPTVEEILAPTVEDTQKVKDYFEKLDAEATEAPIVLEQVELVEEKPKRVKKVKAEKVEDPAPVEKADEVVSDFPYKAKIVASVIHSRKGPGMTFHTARDLYKGTVVSVAEIDGNWGRVGKDLWVNINYIEKI